MPHSTYNSNDKSCIAMLPTLVLYTFWQLILFILQCWGMTSETCLSTPKWPRGSVQSCTVLHPAATPPLRSSGWKMANTLRTTPTVWSPLATIDWRWLHLATWFCTVSQKQMREIMYAGHPTWLAPRTAKVQGSQYTVRHIWEKKDPSMKQ